MFKNIRFHYDERGVWLGTARPRILKAEYCNAEYFYLSSSTMRGHSGSVPCVQVCRQLGPLDKDPYNDDGRPPTVMFTIATPHTEYCSGAVFIEGLEEPNLSWGGLPMLPYSSKPHPDANYLSQQAANIIHRMSYYQLMRQYIILSEQQT